MLGIRMCGKRIRSPAPPPKYPWPEDLVYFIEERTGPDSFGNQGWVRPKWYDSDCLTGAWRLLYAFWLKSHGQKLPPEKWAALLPNWVNYSRKR